MTKYVAESERLWLQPLDIVEHLDDYNVLVSEPLAMIWSMREPSTSLEDSKSMMASRMPTPEKPWNINYAVILKPHTGSSADGRPKLIGTIGIPREEPLGAEVGYGLHPDYWGKGYGTEALKLFINLYWGPSREGSRETILAEIDPENTASERIVEKLGFKRGKLLKGVYQRDVDIRNGKDVLRDLQVWHLQRPK